MIYLVKIVVVYQIFYWVLIIVKVEKSIYKCKVECSAIYKIINGFLRLAYNSSPAVILAFEKFELKVKKVLCVEIALYLISLVG